MGPFFLISSYCPKFLLSPRVSTYRHYFIVFYYAADIFIVYVSLWTPFVFSPDKSSNFRGGYGMKSPIVCLSLRFAKKHEPLSRLKDCQHI